MNRISRWIDERVDLVGIRKALLDRKMPGGLTWWHTLGSATLAVFMVQVVTGIVLAMYYAPSPDHAYDSIRFLEHSVAERRPAARHPPLGRVGDGRARRRAHDPRLHDGLVQVSARDQLAARRRAARSSCSGFGFTGYLLPWDQKAYWATQVGTNIAGTTPVVGALLVKLLRGGSQLGAATLTRFYALHVLLLPALLVVIGAAAPRRWSSARASRRAPRCSKPTRRRRPTTPRIAGYYKERYAASKGAGVRFWPDIVAKDAVDRDGDRRADLPARARSSAPGSSCPPIRSDSSYVPRPEWYFLPFFQLLKLVPGSMESVVAVGVPGALVLALVLLPFFDRRSTRSLCNRPVARFSLFALLGATALLLGASIREPKPDRRRARSRARAQLVGARGARAVRAPAVRRLPRRRRQGRRRPQGRREGRARPHRHRAETLAGVDAQLHRGPVAVPPRLEDAGVRTAGALAPGDRGTLALPRRRCAARTGRPRRSSSSTRSPNPPNPRRSNEDPHV